MQSSQRTRYNHALEYAVGRANDLGIPPVVLVCITPDSPEANARHVAFLVDGLRDVARDLQQRNIRFHLVCGTIPSALSPFLALAAEIVVDRGYLRHHREWRHELAAIADVRLTEIESDVVVPVDQVSDRREYAARTIRPKITSRLDDFLKRLMRVSPTTGCYRGALPNGVDPFSLTVNGISGVDTSIGPVDGVTGGMKEAARLLDRFIARSLDRYAAERNDPLSGVTTELSPYLRLGHISPIDIIRAVRRARGRDHEGVRVLTEELVIRRELSCNFVRHTENYDRYGALPEWSRRTLDDHREDERPHLYDFDELRESRTADRYWNAAMAEMVETGRMRGYMRMYWGKKVLEWSRSPEEAYETLLTLNNAYFLDGGDPNSYANVAWIFGNHDRPWQERPIFGTVRYMNDRGLERKFNIGNYAEKFGF